MPISKFLPFDFDYNKFSQYMKDNKIRTNVLAEKIGITEHSLSNIKTGNRKPSQALYKLICLTLQVDEDMFKVKPPEPVKKAEPEIMHDKQLDRIEVQLDRLERKIDRIEMYLRSNQNENIVIRDALLKIQKKI